MARQHGVIYLDKNIFDFYSELSPNVLRFTFTPDTVRDFDIINHELIINQIKLFVQQNKLAPVMLHIVLSDTVLFGKEIKITDPGKRDFDIQTFLDTVPFESVGSTSVLLPNSVQVLATNKDMYETIKSGFEAIGFMTELVIPALMMKEVNLKNGLVPDSAQFIISRAVALRQYNFISVAMESVELQEQGNKGETAPKNNKRTFLLVGVFVFLILVLVLVIFMTSQPPQVTPSPS